jgi:PAS domain S-box-containing protein
MTLALDTRQQAHSDTELAELPEAVEGVTLAMTADAVFVVDPECRIAYWDARAESLTGLLAEEMIGEPCFEVLEGEREDGTSFAAQAACATRLARGGQPTAGYDVRVFTRSGGRRWVGVSTLVVQTEQGPYLVHLMRDAQAAHETLEMARQLVRLSRGEEPGGAPVAGRRDVPQLTPRQLEVLRLLAAGKSAKEICRELYLSQATVRNHIRALLLVLGAHSQLEALAKAREAGLLAG